MGEYEPNDSRNVTGAGNGAPQQSGVRSAGGADQQDGGQRWNGDGQMEQQSGGADQQNGGQQGDQMGYGSGQDGQQEQFQNNERAQQGGGNDAVTGRDAPVDQQAASQIAEHMEVIGADGVHVGTVDHVEGGRIKLTKKDSGPGIAGGSHEGHHHYISLGLVAGVEGDKVRLSANADVAYGMEEEE